MPRVLPMIAARTSVALIFIIGALLAAVGLAFPPISSESSPEVLPIPAPDSAPAVVVGLIGDTGSGAPFQKAVADQLQLAQQQAAATPPGMQGVLHVGDIIYPAGEIERFGAKLYTAYYQPVWDAGAPFYPVLGNHDVLNGFRPAMLTFYRMPGRYYHFQKTNGPVSVDFYGIDTNIAKDPNQLAWLKNELAQSTADWQIVYGHEPAFSSGAHGDNKVLIGKYLPLFKQYGVDAYLAGHDHQYERFEPKDGTLHVISGGGGAYLRSIGRPKPGSVKRLQAHHFGVLRFAEDTLTGEIIDKTGAVIDRFTHHPQPAALIAP